MPGRCRKFRAWFAILRLALHDVKIASRRQNGLQHEPLESQTYHKELLPDFLVCHDPGFVIIKVKRDGMPVGPGCDWDRFGVIEVADDALPLLFLTLHTCLSHLRLREANWN